MSTHLVSMPDAGSSSSSTSASVASTRASEIELRLAVATARRPARRRTRAMPTKLEPLHRLLAASRPRPRRRWPWRDEQRAEVLAGLVLHRHHHVLQARQPVEQPHVLERARPCPCGRPGRASRPTSSSPFSLTEPASGGMNPVSRLNTVVLPAPLGPTSAVIVPLRSSMSRSSAATMPPKRLLTAARSRARLGASCQRRSPSLLRRRSAARGVGRARATLHGRRAPSPRDHLDARLRAALAADPAPQREALGQRALRAQPHQHDEQRGRRRSAARAPASAGSMSIDALQHRLEQHRRRRRRAPSR